MMELRPLVALLVWRNSSELEFLVHSNSDQLEMAVALSLKVDFLMVFQVNWRKIPIEMETMEGHQAS